PPTLAPTLSTACAHGCATRERGWARQTWAARIANWHSGFSGSSRPGTPSTHGPSVRTSFDCAHRLGNRCFVNVIGRIRQSFERNANRLSSTALAIRGQNLALYPWPDEDLQRKVQTQVAFEWQRLAADGVDLPNCDDDDLCVSMNDSPDRKVDVFTEALQLSTEDRAAFLERACGNDKELLQQVEALLLTHNQVGDFLEEPPQGPSADAQSRISVGEKPGDRIGRYKLLQQIGEGGCGVVFMAEQEEPVRRKVALKIIKPGMDTKSVIARFEAERQALALMDHPNIAKVFDAGATESG